MKRELRNRIMYLIYELGVLLIDEVDVGNQIQELFEMLQILIDEETYSRIKSIWNTEMSATTKEELTVGLMRFDRQARFILIEKNYI